MTHIVMIDCHDLGKHLGCYGRSSVDSRHIDRLARDGVRFDASFCTAPQCSPSRASLYTGRYGHSNGMLGLAHEPFGWRLHEGERYLASYLQSAGYETAHMGIQHVTDFTQEAVRALGFEHVYSGHLAPELADHALTFIARPHERPFFLNIGFFEPHRDHDGAFKVAPPDDVLGVELPSYIPDTPQARQEFIELQGMIKQMDEAVGRIVKALTEHGLLDDTWLIFTTDHGLAMPRAKCTMYDAGIETALIMHAPSLGITGGRTIHQLISHVDMLPTILEGLGIERPTHLHGQSYWHLLQNGNARGREAIYASKTFHTDYEPQRAIRTERYKLIWNAEVDIINVPADVMHSPIYPQMIDELTQERPPFELYDLREDPNERHNLTDDAGYADVLDDLRDLLLRWMQATDDPLLRGAVSSLYYARAMRLLRGDETA